METKDKHISCIELYNDHKLKRNSEHVFFISVDIKAGRVISCPHAKKRVEINFHECRF